MPYIKQERRDMYDEYIRKLVETVHQKADVAETPGDTNYIITSLILGIIKRRFHGNIRYWMLAAATGVLENVKQEMYRKMFAPYEDEKAAENGDLYAGEETTDP